MKKSILTLVAGAAIIAVPGFAQDISDEEVPKAIEAPTVAVPEDKGPEIEWKANKTPDAEPAARNEGDAKSAVLAALKDAGLKKGYDKKRDAIIEVGHAKVKVKNPAESAAFLPARNMLVSEAMLMAKSHIITRIRATYSAEERAKTIVGTPENEVYAKSGVLPKPDRDPEQEVRENETMFEEIARMPLFGCNCIVQKESYAGGEYMVAVAVVWSRKLQESGFATLMGSPHKEIPGKASLEGWLDSIQAEDIACMLGSRNYVDKNGYRHFIGIAAGEEERKSDRIALEAAAKRHALFALFADVDSYSYVKEQMSIHDGELPESVKRDVLQNVGQRISNLPVEGLGIQWEKTVVQPFAGKEVTVAVAAIDPVLAKDARGIFRDCFAKALALAIKSSENPLSGLKPATVKGGLGEVSPKGNGTAQPQEGVGGDPTVNTNF